MWPFRKRGIDLWQMPEAPPAAYWVNLMVLRMVRENITVIELRSDEPLPRIEEWNTHVPPQPLPTFEEILARFRQMGRYGETAVSSPETIDIQFTVGGAEVLIHASVTEQQSKIQLNVRMTKTERRMYAMKVFESERLWWPYPRWKTCEVIGGIAAPEVSLAALTTEPAPRGRWYGYLLGLCMHRTQMSTCMLLAGKEVPNIGDWSWREDLPPADEVLAELPVLCGDAEDTPLGRFEVDTAGGPVGIRVHFHGQERATLSLEQPNGGAVPDS